MTVGIGTRLRSAVAFLWTVDRPLTAVGLLMTAAAILSALGLVADARVIAGFPAWLKPLKFATSTGIYCFTLAWIFSYLPDWSRTRRWVSLVTAIVIVLEVGAIDVQAWRGTTSHFNTSTPANAIVFGLMGLGILTQTLATCFAAAALWRQKFADPVMGWALRLGMTMTIAGAFIGFLMTAPTSAQIAQAKATHRMPVSGAHSVGGPDGGPGVPGTGWSTEHGDLRVPHFLGLHSIQALAIIGLIVRRRRVPTDRGVRIVQAAAVSYTALVVMFLWQALRGESVVTPGGMMQTLGFVWLASSAALLWATVTRQAGTATASAVQR
jgi:hypothetical protein